MNPNILNSHDHTLLPSEAVKNQSIERILSVGVPTPRRLSSAVPALLKTVGLRGLFFGAGDCAFLALSGAVLLWICLFAVFHNQSMISVSIFFGSPFLYALLHLLTVWKQIMTGTYELLAVCRCSLRQLTALRMLVFGGISVIFIVCVSVGMRVFLTGSPSILRLMSISFAALFLFGLLDLVIEWKWTAPGSCFAAPIIWGLISVCLLLANERTEALMRNVPTFVFGIAAVLSAFLYLRTLKHYYFDPKEGALYHAVS